MVTPAVSLNSIQPRNPLQELTLTSSRSESTSDITQVERSSDSLILPAQVVSVTTLSEEVAPTDQNEAGVGNRALGAQDSSYAQYDAADQALIRELAARDREVRQHELAHKSVAGSLAGPVNLEYQRGPDGQMYAVGGEVDIRTNPASSDPRDVLQYAEQLLRAALAPAEPSTQDRQVAAQARVMLAQAQAEIASQQLDSSGAGAGEAETEVEAGGNFEEPVLEEAGGASQERESQFEIAAVREQTAESLAEFQQTLDAVSQRLVEVNQRLVELGVLEETYQPGVVFDVSA